jgi:arylsulfatase A-like enzyme
MKQPNILVVLCDQMRRSAMSCAGDPNVATPNLDRLASEGARFTAACSTYPVCVPTRFTFMTGEYAHTRFVPPIGWRMSPAERTIAHELNEAGYETAYIGKWHLFGSQIYELRSDNGFAPVPRAFQGGFQHWRGFELRNDPFGTVFFIDGEEVPRVDEGYQTDIMFDQALHYLDNRGFGKPFFLVVSVEPPHPPLIAPESYSKRWEGRDLTLPPNMVTDKKYKMRGPGCKDILDEMRTYYAMIENLDDNIGRLLHHLEETGLRENTAIVFLSDHGELMGSHGLQNKSEPFEESAGIPFIVSYAEGGITGGKTIEVPVSTEDWYPTLLGLAGVKPHTDKPGADLTSLLTGRVDRLDRPGIMLEYVGEPRRNANNYPDTWRAFRTDRYKYTVKGGAKGGEPWQLFDLRDDPYEMSNLIDRSDYGEIAGAMHEHLRNRMLESNDDYALVPAFGKEGLHNWRS